MTVLLIDDIGRVKEIEVSSLIPVILIPLPIPFNTWALGKKDETYRSYRAARFTLTRELSYPPVYRYSGTE